MTRICMSSGKAESHHGSLDRFDPRSGQTIGNGRRISIRASNLLPATELAILNPNSLNERELRRKSGTISCCHMSVIWRVLGSPILQIRPSARGVASGSEFSDGVAKPNRFRLSAYAACSRRSGGVPGSNGLAQFVSSAEVEKSRH